MSVDFPTERMHYEVYLDEANHFFKYTRYLAFYTNWLGLPVVPLHPSPWVWGHWALLPRRSPPTCRSNKGAPVQKAAPQYCNFLVGVVFSVIAFSIQ